MAARTTISRSIGLAFVLPLFGAGIAASVASAQDVSWVSELEENLKLIGQEIVVEGTFQQRAGANRDQIRLQYSKVEFQLSAELVKTLPPNLRGSLRIRGTLTKSENKLVVRVNSLTKTSTTDVDRYQDLANKIARNDFRRWNELADRTRRLAEFLGSSELKGLAQEARSKGFHAEEASLEATQIDELLALANRANEVGLNEDEVRRLRHKALRWQFDVLSTGAAKYAEWRNLADKIATLLPGARTPLKSNESRPASQYDSKPIEVYDAEAASRDLFDRGFWLKVAAQSFAAASEVSGADLQKLAAEAKRLLPDKLELSLQILKKWADAEEARLPSLPPASQVRKLAEILRTELAKPDRAQAVLRQWLELRRGRLSKRDAEGRIQLAYDFRADLNDTASAVKILLEAIDIEPELPEAIDELRSLGFVKSPEGWIPVNSPPHPGKPSTGGARGRLPTIDMTPNQVKEILGDPKPEDVVRIGTAGIVVEQWLYRGPPDLYVSFHMSKSAGARVLSIKTQPSK